MEELERIRYRIIKLGLTDVYIVAVNVNSANQLIKRLKTDIFKDLNLTYLHVVTTKYCEGICDRDSIVILWSRWFQNHRINQYIIDWQSSMPHVFNLGDFHWLKGGGTQ